MTGMTDKVSVARRLEEARAQEVTAEARAAGLRWAGEFIGWTAAFAALEILLFW